MQGIFFFYVKQEQVKEKRKKRISYRADGRLMKSAAAPSMCQATSQFVA